MGGGLVGLAGVLAVLQALLVNVGTSLIDPDRVRPWAWLVWTAIAVLGMAGVVAGVVLSRRDSRGDGIGAGPRVAQRARISGAGAVSTQIAGDQVNIYHPPQPPPAPAPVPAVPAAASNLPLRNPTFTGRADLLGRLGPGLSDGPVAVVAVRGLGGVGKSQAALEYAHRGRTAGSYSITWWVRAETDLTLAEDLAGLAPALGVQAGADQQETVAGVRAALQTRDRWLLVFDNAPSVDAVRGWLPDGPGHVLITSRSRGWAGVARQLDVEAFDRAESVEYLRVRLGRDDPDADALAEALGDLPLALAQAASWIDLHGNPPVARYLALYREWAGAGVLLAEAAGDGYPHTVATTWLIHFTDLAATAPAAPELLRLCAHLDPDDIDLALILSRPELLDGPLTAHLAAAAATARGREDALGALARTGLVHRLDNDRVRIHRLVAEITRSELAAPSAVRTAGQDDSDHGAQGAGWAAQAIAVVGGLFPLKPWEPATWPVCNQLAPHAAAVLDLAARRPTLDLATGIANLLARLG